MKIFRQLVLTGLSFGFLLTVQCMERVDQESDSCLSVGSSVLEEGGVRVDPLDPHNDAYAIAVGDFLDCVCSCIPDFDITQSSPVPGRFYADILERLCDIEAVRIPLVRIAKDIGIASDFDDEQTVQELFFWLRTARGKLSMSKISLGSLQALNVQLKKCRGPQNKRRIG